MSNFACDSDHDSMQFSASSDASNKSSRKLFSKCVYRFDKIYRTIKITVALLCLVLAYASTDSDGCDLNNELVIRHLNTLSIPRSTCTTKLLRCVW